MWKINEKTAAIGVYKTLLRTSCLYSIPALPALAGNDPLDMPAFISNFGITIRSSLDGHSLLVTACQHNFDQIGHVMYDQV
jgi:hypothetical protein